tara:strand:- start:95 stop:697 length:603 start_codon:yes stop_codon:yes gene_type:complete
MEWKVTTKEMLRDLLFILPQVEEKYGELESYKTLICYLKENNWTEDESLCVLTIKMIMEATGLSRQKLSTKLKRIYNELFSSEETIDFEFSESELIFCVPDSKENHLFRFKGVKHIPKVGENVSLPFLDSKVRSQSFYVESVYHEFRGNKHEIFIGLKSGYFNTYWHFRKEKAWATNEIDYREMIKLNDYELKERLKIKK